MAGGFGNKQESGSELSAAELLWVQTGTAGVVLFEEQASAPSFTSNYGKLYVKDSDHNLYFLDEAGNEYQLTPPSGGAGQTIEIPTGTIDDSNLAFVFTEEPFLINVNGSSFRKGAGWSWDLGTLTATLREPPAGSPGPVGIGGDIFGIMQ